MNLLYKIARELVAMLGIAELVLGTYIGFRFGEGDTFQAWFFTGILALVAYSSTRLWVWVMEKMTKHV